MAVRLKMRDVSAMQVDVGLGERGADHETGQVSFARFKGGDSGDFQAAQGGGRFHRPGF